MAARWYTWAMVVTSSGIVGTRILATYFETGWHVHGRAAGKRSTERKCFASSVCRLVRPLLEVEPQPVARRHRAFIKSRAFSKMTTFDSKADSRKDWSFKFENMAAAVVSRRESLLSGQLNRKHPYWRLAMSKQVPIPLKSIPKEHYAQACKLGGNSSESLTRRQWDGNGRCWVASSILEQWQCMSCHEPLSSGKNVSDRVNPEREKNSDDVRSRILTEMCPEHIKTHIHFNLTRMPDYAAVRSEIETFLEARQSISNPDAMDIGSLDGQKGDCRSCGQRGHWAADCPKRGKNGQGGKGEDGKEQGKKRQVKQREHWWGQRKRQRRQVASKEGIWRVLQS